MLFIFIYIYIILESCFRSCLHGQVADLLPLPTQPSGPTEPVGPTAPGPTGPGPGPQNLEALKVDPLVKWVIFRRNGHEF